MVTEELCYCQDMFHWQRCVPCQDRALAEEVQRECAFWSWNNTPRECAERAKELGWSKQTLESGMRKHGYNRDNIEQVLFEFEIGE